MTDRRLVLAMCAGEIVCLLPLAAFPTLVPLFIGEWGLTNTEAGWLGGINALGYMLAVPLLVGLTDRIDARLVFLAAALFSSFSCLGYALLADGFWSAMVWRGLHGIGLAGTYMPGLKAITDRYRSGAPSRAITLYTASYSVGAGMSVLAAGLIGGAFGWRAAFTVTGLGPLLALAIAAAVLRPEPPAPKARGARLLDFRPVLRNREAMSYVLAYAGHGYELNALRTWMVAFLAFAAGRDPSGSGLLGPTLITTIVILLGLPASVFGNELALRFGRRRVVSGLMAASAAVSCLVGFAAALPLWAVIGIVLLYGAMATADSGSLTAGAVAAATPDAQGATMAVHSTLGFGASFFGPLLVGIALDLCGGTGSITAWGIGFMVGGLGAAAGSAALLLCRRRSG